MHPEKIEIVENHSLKAHNSFGIEAKASFFCEIHAIHQFEALFSSAPYRLSANKLFLGGGSNVLFTKDFDGIVIKIAIKGISITDATNEAVFIKAGAGEIWHDLVMYCVENEFYGIENLSLIPGTVGASPIQNIGAYGVEVKDSIVSVEVIDVEKGKLLEMPIATLKMGYRDSIFKNEAKGKYIITAVNFKLSRTPQFNLSYGAIQTTLKESGVNELTIKSVSNAIISIRKSKLPNPAEIGNAGSFFKNPTVAIDKLQLLLKAYPAMPHYAVNEFSEKLAAGWLIEQCGWKGKRVGDAGVHKDQALVLVNHGNASGQEIKQLAEEIIASVYAKFGITLASEVNIV